MTSSSSGYVTVRRNVSSSDADYVERFIPVPSGATVFVSYKELVSHVVDVELYRYYMEYDEDTGHDTETFVRVWWRSSDFKSDFLHVFQATQLHVLLGSHECFNTDCFKLFFSFFHSRSLPQKFSSGLWNCSVSYYPRIHYHLSCNHKIECEDGRDETEHCPFSSPECQGLVAICNHCYQFVRGLDAFSHRLDDNVLQMGNKYCNALGATFSFPKCTYNWYSAFRNKTKLHPETLNNIWTGLYSNDMSLPSLYRHVILNDKTVLYHSFPFPQTISHIDHFGERMCYELELTHLNDDVCLQDNEHWQKSGLSCEFRTNNTARHSPHSQTVSLPSRHVPLPPGQDSMTVCAQGHVTHTFFLCSSKWYEICILDQASPCDVSDEISLYNKLHSTSLHISIFPIFTCNNRFTLSYTLVCDFITDCQDKSDESVCTFSACLNLFTCDSGQCVSYDNVCDQTSHCYDETDEKNCDMFTWFLIEPVCIPFPAFITFDSVSKFIAVPLTSNDSCPDSHYRCPGDFNDCLPVYTRCNGMYDCLDHQDEEGCEDMTCPGFFRCRVSTICVHNDHLCDGWSHCPLHDDELLCDVTCPVDCVCQGHTFLCFQPFPAALFAQLRYLDATGSGMTLSDINGHTHLFHLILARCFMTHLPDLRLYNVRILDLSDNELQHFNVTSLLGLHNLHVLSLFSNPLTSIYIDNTAGLHQGTLQMLDLSYTTLKVYDAKVFSSFPRLQTLNLTSTHIHTISPGGFQFVQQLTELYLDGSPIETFPLDLFKNLHHLRIIVTDNYKLCCHEILPFDFDYSSCHTPKSEISSCKDLLQSWTYRGFLWLAACLSVTGNIFCFCARFFSSSMRSSVGFGMFVINLTVADFLMGIYIIIIGIADEQFRGTYLHNDNTWKDSAACTMAGVLSLLSSEVSALIIWIITLDRFVVLHFPFSSLRFDRVSAAVACLLIWVVGLLLALVPLLPLALHWKFYGQTGICIPLSVTTKEFEGRWYSFSILIAFNFVLFLFISVGQTLIYWSIQKSTMKTNTTKVSRDMTIARRLITVAVTDFMCWFPIGMCGILAQLSIPVPSEVNVALAIFVLPLNSAVNPFMYTFNIIAEKRKISAEAKLVNWMESHADMIVS